ncbi:MAG: hypothetical protein ACQESP_01825 [Candidatus Muiribacteriota bacterium]
MSINTQNLNSTAESVSIKKTNTFRVGDFLKGKVLGFTEKKPVLQFKGEAFTASSEVPLRIGQTLDVYVQKKEAGKTYLKIIDPQSSDKDSEILNALLNNSLKGSLFNIIKSMINQGLTVKSAVMTAKLEMTDNPEIIELFKEAQELEGEMSSFKDFYSFLLKKIPEEHVSEFKEKFILPSETDKNKIISILKNSLNSFEHKLKENQDTSNDMKDFMQKIDNSFSDKIIKFLDLNNILNSQDKLQAILNIPYFLKNSSKIKYSQLEMKSSNRFNKKKTVSIFFVLDMSNAQLLKINALYYMEGKNININFISQKEEFLDLIHKKSSELTDKLEKQGLNVYLNFIYSTEKEKIKKNNIRKTTKLNKGGIDIKA